MKDAYSFDRDAEGLNASYEKMYDAYCRIFKRCGLDFMPVEADTGVMGGDVSHEFMVMAESGEDKIVCCAKCGYAASMDKAECVKSEDIEQNTGNRENLKKMEEVETPGVSSVKDVSEFLKIGPGQLVKTLIYMAADNAVAVLVRGDHEINETKLMRALKSANIRMADEAEIQKITGGPIGFSGPAGLAIPVLADSGIRNMSNFIIGANKKDRHFINANAGRDFKVGEWGDLRNITPEDSCPKCGAPIEIKQAIEVGHVFKLGTKYTQSLDASFLNEQGESRRIIR